MKFPLVDAFLTAPDAGKDGKIGICTNTLAPGMVQNEIPEHLRSDVVLLGSLVVSRDGAERLIVNCLAHPTIEYLILFGEETLSFRPSSNILLALMDGYQKDKPGNMIVKGIGISHQYPSISKKLLEMFRKKMKVIPIYKHENCKHIIERYMEWLKPRIPIDVYNKVIEIQNKKKIYFDSLNELIGVVEKQQSTNNESIELDPKDFQHLAPPVIRLDDQDEITEVPFQVLKENNEIVVNLDIKDNHYVMKGNDSFLMAYSFMKLFNENKIEISPTQQLLLGAEMSRIEVEIRNNIKHKPFVNSKIKYNERTTIPVEARTFLKPDKKYYYKLGMKEDLVYIQSLAHDTCESVFELQSKKLMPFIKKLVKENRFEDYEQQFLHRLDVGIEAGRAIIALETGNSYFQDFRNLFSINKNKFPLLICESDSFLTNHKQIITKLYTTGITMQHPDTHKGTMRSATTLAVYRDSKNSLAKIPGIYGSGSQSATQMREAYKEELLSAEARGSYTYGHRTRTHFGVDQLQAAIEHLKNNPVFIIQRFDFNKDMTLKETDIGTRIRIEATHDPCLTHDIYFKHKNKLHSFHIARAHNIVNAYPENIFGLHDAYDNTIAEGLNMELGDMFVLSNRGNILILTEEQKTKKLIAEPSKPMMDADHSMGPYNIKDSVESRGIGFMEIKMEKQTECTHPCLELLENYQGINLINKAADYLKKKGNAHNNPIIGCFNPENPEFSNKTRLVFFQCNQRGGKLQASAVFLNGKKSTIDQDIELCNYITTKYSEVLELDLDNLFLFYVPLVE